ncbi:MAG: hypothetical protein QXV64_02195 [Candidatus Anstonellaceae archaeon]
MQQKIDFKLDKISLLTIGVILCLFFSLLALYSSLEKEKGLTTQQKAYLKEIANQLRKLQQKDLFLVAPIKATVYVQKEIAANEVIPENLLLVVNTTLPVNKTLEAVTSKGEIIRLQIIEDIPIEGYIPIKYIYSINESKIKIDQQLPIDSKFSLTFRVSAIYGQELNEIIQKLEELSK